MSLSRRKFLGAATLGATSAFVGEAASYGDPATAIPADSDYNTLTLRGYNRRFIAHPDEIFVPSNAIEVQDAVDASIRANQRIAVRSGGHCFDDFVDSPDTRALIDLQRMNSVDWDHQYGAFSVSAGADLETVYRELARWGVTIPGGICRNVGVGGHISGGGYGPLSRQYGLVADHLYGVEIVTVDSSGRSALTIATREGPNRDLWWAHTGGGGGNFGIVTRFFLRTPTSDGSDPSQALPPVPDSVVVGHLVMPMPLSSEDSFAQLLNNYLDFYARYRQPRNRYAAVFARLNFHPIIESFADLLVFSHGDGDQAYAQLDEFLTAVTSKVKPAPLVLPPVRVTYIDCIDQFYAPRPANPFRVKIKTALLRQPYSADQLKTLYRGLVDPVMTADSFVEFAPFGGMINAVAVDATAMPARDSFMKMLIHAAWREPANDEQLASWARKIYRELYSDTGFAPVPNERNGGCYINYPDPDLADPEWNTSSLPWHGFYYGSGYPRLQRIKADWDPNNNFRHRLSIEQP
ncbi:FAD-binding oxidoreductase [Nocardia sp. CDC160]|uniref:FAD-binding oxidoreductase n=1 Tax=Nocardia sp. CDC160 TaxID=3112166 RepID=UPI002DB57AFA|nr:FAD-binding protein [Nocardia sp. CDC160]MEC3920238.1 FAD-binding protein [Nocardia sp. CDC160]